MTTIKKLVALCGLILLTVTFHELGHFIAAKLCSVPVEEFSVGLGPKIFTKEFFGTQWTISAFPLGGYNMISEDALIAMNLPTYVFIVAMGPMFSVLPFIILNIMRQSNVQKVTNSTKVTLLTQTDINPEVLEALRVKLQEAVQAEICEAPESDGYDPFSFKVAGSHFKFLGFSEMMNVSTDSIQRWFIDAVYFSAIIGIANLFPILPLDGGIITMSAIYAFLGKNQFTQSVEFALSILGYMLLTLSWVIPLTKDLFKSYLFFAKNKK